MNLLESLNTVLSKEINESIAEHPGLINRLANTLYNYNCGNCDNKRTEIYLRLYREQNQLRIKLKEIMERTFELKEGNVLVMSNPKMTGTFTNKNITDKDAIKILKHNKTYISQFAKYPDNWKDLIADKPKAKAKPKAEKKEPEKKPAEKDQKK